MVFFHYFIVHYIIVERKQNPKNGNFICYMKSETKGQCGKCLTLWLVQLFPDIPPPPFPLSLIKDGE